VSDVIGAMFLGEFQHTLDPKGRVILPSAFREQLKEGLVMTVGLDHCVNVHPVADWQRYASELRSLRATSARERGFARMVMSSAHPDVPDRQGRITIPSRLRDFADLSKDVAVVGNDSKVELWDATKWEAYRDANMEDFANTEQPFNLGVF
jgi:MraZ protein